MGRWLVLCPALVLVLGCTSSGGGGGGCPPDAGTCGPFGNGGAGTGAQAGTGGAGNTGGFGNSAATGGFGNTRNTGGFGNTGNTGGFGNTGNTGGSGNTGNTGGSGGATPNSNLGRACFSNAECGLGLTCIQAGSGAFDGGGPAQGLCTADCTFDEFLCDSIKAGGVCVDYDGTAFCLEGCSFGPDGGTSFDPSKCHGREEVACAPFFDTAGQFSVAACAPQCNSNADCGGGLYCSPKTGLCTSSAPTGLSLGQTCTLPTSGGVDNCKGNCTNFVDDTGQTLVNMCVESCTLGAQPPTCGWNGAPPAPAACLFVATAILDNGGAGLGDQGSCGLLCDCNSDCNSALVCVPWSGPNAQATKDYFQRNGFCGDGSPGIPTCN